MLVCNFIESNSGTLNSRRSHAVQKHFKYQNHMSRSLFVVLSNDKALISPSWLNMYNTHYGKTLLGCKTVICILNIHTKCSHLVSSLFYQLKCIKKITLLFIHFRLLDLNRLFGNPWTCCKEKNNIQVSAWQVVEGTHGLGKKQKGRIISSLPHGFVHYYKKKKDILQSQLESKHFFLFHRLKHLADLESFQ